MRPLLLIALLWPFSRFPCESSTAKCYGRAELGALLKTCWCGHTKPGTPRAHAGFKHLKNTTAVFFLLLFVRLQQHAEKRICWQFVLSLGACGCACSLIFAIRTPRPKVDMQRLAFTVLSSTSEYTGYTQVKRVEDVPAIHRYTHTRSPARTYTHAKPQSDHVQFSGWAERSLQEKQARCQE